MKRVLTIALAFACLTACIDKDPSWRISWETPVDPGGRVTPTPHPGDDPGSTDPDKPLPEVVELMQAFTEEFDSDGKANFNYREKVEDFRYYPAFPSLTESDKTILMLRLDPADPAGRAGGAELSSKECTYYGSYGIRLKLPDITKAQPKLGAAFTFNVEGSDSKCGITRIQMQWRPANPAVLHVSTATGEESAPNTFERTIDLAKGSAISTTGEIASVPAIKDFNAAGRIYIYGFDWYEDHLDWWISTSTVKDRTVLLSMEDHIPVVPGYLCAGFYHSGDIPAHKVDGSTQTPKYPFELEIDWISYTPFDHE